MDIGTAIVGGSTASSLVFGTAWVIIKGMSLSKNGNGKEKPHCPDHSGICTSIDFIKISLKDLKEMVAAVNKKLDAAAFERRMVPRE